MRDKQVSRLLTLYLWLFLAIITIPGYFALNWPYGDTLFLESLFVDLFEHGGHWSSWSQTTSPAYIPDLPLYYVAYHLFGYTMDRLFFVTFFQIVLVCAAMLFILRYALGELNNLTRFAVFAIYATFVFGFYRYGMWLFLNGSNFLMDSHIFSLLSLGLLLKIYREDKKRDLWLLVAAAITGTIDGRAYLIWFWAPAMATLGLCLVAQYYAKSPLFRRTAAMLLVLLGAVAAANLLGPLISRWDTLSMVGRGRFNITDAINSLTPFKNIMVELMTGSRLMYRLWFALWALAMLAGAWALIRMTRRYCRALPPPFPRFLARLALPPAAGAPQDFAWYFFVLFTLVLVPANFFIVTASGEFYNSEGLRYYQIAVNVPLVLLAGFAGLYFHRIAEARATRVFIFSSVTLCLALFSLRFEALKPRDLTVEGVRNHERVYEKEVSDCFDDNKEKYGLKYGLGEFWIARSNSLLSQKDMRMYPLYSFWNTDAYFYMDNVDWFLGAPDSKYPNPEYNYIANPKAYGEYDIINELGPPSAMFDCPGTTVRVYAGDTLDKVFKMRAANHLDNIKFQYGVLDEFTMRSPRPYEFVMLPGGHYQIELRFRIDPASPGKPAGSWEVSDLDGWLVHRSYLVPDPGGEVSVHTMDFRVPRSLTGKKRDYLIKTIANDGLIIESFTMKRL